MLHPPNSFWQSFKYQFHWQRVVRRHWSEKQTAIYSEKYRASLMWVACSLCCNLCKDGSKAWTKVQQQTQYRNLPHIVRPCLGYLSFLTAHYVVGVNLRLQSNLSPLQLRCFCIPYMICSMMQSRFASDSPNNDPDNLSNGWAKLHIFVSSGVGGIIRPMPKHCWCFPTIMVQEGLHCLKIFLELKPVAPTITAECSDLTAIADAVSKFQS